MTSPSQTPRWDSFEQDGHTFVRTPEDSHVWRCGACGSTKNDYECYTALPDDTWAELRVDGRTTTDFETCAEACALLVLGS